MILSGKELVMKKWLINTIPVVSMVAIVGCILLCFFTGFTMQEGERFTSLQSKIFLYSLCIMVSQILLCFCSRWLPKWYACEAMGWHKRPKAITDVGVGSFTQNNGVCSRCHKEVTQDSQGNWF